MESQKEPDRTPNTSQGDIVIKEVMSLESVRETLTEEQGYDAPFATFTWKHWMDLHARAMQCFSRFVRSVEEHHPDHAMMIGLEMQEIATTMLLEAYAQSAHLPLEDVPAGHVKRTGP